MAFPSKYVETGSLLGAWPTVPSVVTGNTVLLPRTMLRQATLLGIAREPSGGYDVDGRSFLLDVDGSPYTVTFSFGSPLPLAEVISEVNSSVGFTVAYNDNGFLKLLSPTIGDGSHLKISTDPSSTPTDVLVNLGFTPESESTGGDFVQAQHVDPDRQVATHGQMTLAEGESFEAKVFNRAIAQLSLNNDRNEGLLSKKRVATQDQITVSSYTTPGAVHGYQFTGGTLVYTGKNTAPGVAALGSLFGILDGEGREFSKDVYFPTDTGLTGTFSTAVDGTSRQICTSTFFTTLVGGAYETGNYYLLSSSFTGGAAVLNGKPLKLVEIDIGAGEAAIENVNPATGLPVVITDVGIGFTIVRRDRDRVVVDGVYENVTTATAGTPRLENVEVSKRSAIVPTNIEMGNRVTFVGEDFTAAPAVQVGDLVVWSGSTIDSPFVNNGTYRVDKILDPETLQLVAEDWGAALLNPNLSGGTVGTVDITTDGDFVLDPFIRFAGSLTTFAQPENGDALRILYLKGSTFREASDNDPALFSGSVRYSQEADDTVARAITRMWGPSVTSIDDVLYQDYRLNLESINDRLNHEHYKYDDAEKTGSSATDTRSWGRHKDIRPDTIDMWYHTPLTNAARVTLRGTATRGHGSDSQTGSDSLLKIRNSADQFVFYLDADGRIHNQSSSASSDNKVFINLQFESNRDEPNNLGGYNVTGERVIFRGTHHWYDAVADAVDTSLIGLDLIHDLELTSTSASKFDALVGERIIFSASSANIVGATSLKFLNLTGSFDSGATQADNQDSYNGFYGIHLDYVLSSAVKLNDKHYGIKVEDITRGETATGVTTTPTANYSIYTGLGFARFGDEVWIDGSFSTRHATDGIMGALNVDPDFTAGTGFNRWGVQSTPTSTHTTGAMGNLWAVRGVATASGSGGSSNSVVGGSFTGSVGSGHTSASTIGVRAATVNTGTVTDSYGVFVAPLTNATNNYGVYINAPTGGTLNYALFSEGDVYLKTATSPTLVGTTSDLVRVARNTTASPGGSSTALNVTNELSYASTDSKYAVKIESYTSQASPSSFTLGGILNIVKAETSAALAGTLQGYGASVFITDSAVGGARGYFSSAPSLSGGAALTNWSAFEAAATSTAVSGYKRGLSIGAVSGSATTNYGVYVDSVSGGTTSIGSYLGAVTGSSTGIGVSIGAITGASEARGIKLGSIDASAGPAYGFSCGDVSGTGGVDTYGLFIGEVSGDGTSSSNSEGLHVDAVNGGYSSSVGVHIGPVGVALAGLVTSIGLQVDSVTGAIGGYGLYVGTVDASSGAYGLKLGDVTGSPAYAIYTGAGTVHFGDFTEVERSVIGDHALLVKNPANADNAVGMSINAGLNAPINTGDCRWIYLKEGDGGVQSIIEFVSGGGAHFSSPSDERLKTNIAPTKLNGVDILSRIELKSFDWKSGARGKEIGYIAQQVQEVYPTMVSKGEDGYLNVGDSVLVPLLVKAVQELNDRIKILEAA